MQRRGRKTKKGSTDSGTPVPAGSMFDNQPSSSRARSGGAPKPVPTRGGNTSLAEGLMFSHKPNPIFDTNETQSSRGDDYEVINLSNEAAGRHNSGSSIAGMSGFSGGTALLLHAAFQVAAKFQLIILSNERPCCNQRFL